MSGVYGDRIKMSIFGESHGPAIGLVIDGLPAGVVLDFEAINREMQRRAPGRNKMSTPRQEKDAFIVQSGLFEGKTTGTPLCALIPNSDAHSKDYSLLKNVMRPGHADYVGKIKYGGFNDYRGGGSFSGRLTAPLVFMGAVAKQCLAPFGVVVGAHIKTIGQITDRSFAPLGETAEVLEKLTRQELPVLEAASEELMLAEILKAREEKDSVGGTIECMAINLPAGVGAPFFDSLESRLAHGLFSVPAVKGLEFGTGFALSQMRGSTANDAMYFDEAGQVRTKTNHNGGILGGISNGMPLIFCVGIKPTPSIAQKQETVDVAKKINTTLEITGRHDPCIVQRAVPVIEGVAAWVLLDMLLTSDLQNLKVDR